jgi:hypothetical protein
MRSTLDLLPGKSATAITKIVRQLGTQGDLRRAFAEAGSNASIQSCSATAHLIFDKINGVEFSAGKMSVFVKPGMLNFWSKGQNMPMSAEAVVNEIDKLLDRPVAICISVKRDHHFVVLPIDDNRIAILQAFQHSYSLADWLQWCGVGCLTKAAFKEALLDLVASSGKQTWTAAAVRLFSFESSPKRPANSVLSPDKVRQDIKQWFCDKPYLVAYAYKEL